MAVSRQASAYSNFGYSILVNATPNFFLFGIDKNCFFMYIYIGFLDLFI